MGDVKLYAWQPQGHGQYSFFVCAENEEAARAAVDEHILREHKSFAVYAALGWGTDYYSLTVLEPGRVIENANE